jgi:hypothetical protein
MCCKYIKIIAPCTMWNKTIYDKDSLSSVTNVLKVYLLSFGRKLKQSNE